MFSYGKPTRSVPNRGGEHWNVPVVAFRCVWLHRRQEMQYRRFSDWQVKWSRMLCALFRPSKKSPRGCVLTRLAYGPSAGKRTGIRGETARYQRRRGQISPRSRSRRFDTSRCSGIILRASGLEDKMLKFKHYDPSFASLALFYVFRTRQELVHRQQCQLCQSIWEPSTFRPNKKKIKIKVKSRRDG